jgi:hypothetical protein
LDAIYVMERLQIANEENTVLQNLSRSSWLINRSSKFNAWSTKALKLTLSRKGGDVNDHHYQNNDYHYEQQKN